MMKPILIGLLLASLMQSLTAQEDPLTPLEIISIADKKLKGNTSKGVLNMTIQRPTWSRTVEMKSWTMGDEYSIILITAPARDKGTGFLKRGKEIWNWQPTIDRSIKLPPSMMMQSWMGSDLTNDDLVRQSSIVKDYEHQLVGSETIYDRDCYILELLPHQDAPVVWGKIKIWIDKKDFLQLKTLFYDEEDYLVNTIYGKEIKLLGGQLIPSILEVVPEEEEGHKTIIEYKELVFDIPMKEAFFSIQNLKRIR